MSALPTQRTRQPAPRHAATVCDEPAGRVRRSRRIAALAATAVLAGALTAGPRADASVHTVAPGEAVWTIAVDNGLTVEALALANGLEDPAVISVGQQLVIPTSPSGRTDGRIHLVAPGETLWSVARLHDVPLGLLARQNGIGADALIRVGQVLDIPEPGTDLDVPRVPADRAGLRPVFEQWAAAYGVPADLLAAIAWFESGWDNETRSSAGAIGIGQLLPITAGFVGERLIGETLDPTDAEDNIRLSARYLRYLLDETGSVRLAVAAWYQGLDSVRIDGIHESSTFYVEGVTALRARFA